MGLQQAGADKRKYRLAPAVETLETRQLFAVLGAPTGLVTTPLSTNQIKLNWVDTSTGEAGFKIERSVNGGTFRRIGRVNGNITNFVDTANLASGTTYTYRLFAYTGTEDGPYSDLVQGTTNLGGPQDVQASAGSRAHVISLKWTDVNGESSYLIERSSDGSTWANVGAVAANATLFTDTALSANTSYRYRVSAVNGSVSAPSADVLGSTSDYRVLDATGFTNKPQPIGSGVETIHMTGYHGYFDWRDRLRKDYTYQSAHDAAALGQSLCIDIESFMWDIRSTSTSTSDATIATFNQILKWVHQAEPELKVGIYGEVPVAAPAALQDPSALSAWRNANDYVLTRLKGLDYLMPSLYTMSYDNMKTWESRSEATLKEAERFGLPVVPFIMMQYENTGQWMPNDIWQMELAVTRKFADGAILWTGDSSSWNPNAQWWQTTQKVIAETSPPAAVPTGLTINELDANLSWDTLPADVDAVMVERSFDGASWELAEYVGRDQNHWRDPLLHAGVTSFYRLRATNGMGTTGPGSVVSTVPSRSAFTEQQAESRDGASVDTRYNGGTSIGNGLWLQYNAIHFDEGANQLLLKMDLPPQNAGMRVQVRLDSLNGQLIADKQLGTTFGWGDSAIQSIPLSAVTGVHDVYLSFVGGVTSAAFDWLRFVKDGTPSQPVHLKSSSFGTGVSMTWYDESADESGFRVERSTNGGSYMTLATLPAESTSYIDNAIAAGSRYSYRVVAFNGNGSSGATNVARGLGGTQDGYQVFQAESVDESSARAFAAGGIAPAGAAFNAGQTMRLYSVDFGSTGAATFTMRVAVPSTIAGQQVEVHLDDPNGTLVGTLTTAATAKDRKWGPNGGPPPPTQAYITYKVQTTNISGASGVHDVYLVAKGYTFIGNVDWFQFGLPVAPADPGTTGTVVSAPAEEPTRIYQTRPTPPPPPSTLALGGTQDQLQSSESVLS
ncbi:MAG TPA: carbohydrate-binding protein [Tepidisphaeraceae bacterium]|jgi:hypothetical protein